jgi:hypothetical protein
LKWCLVEWPYGPSAKSRWSVQTRLRTRATISA